jgi:hypothetical protein
MTGVFTPTFIAIVSDAVRISGVAHADSSATVASASSVRAV